MKSRDESLLRITDTVLQKNSPGFIPPFEFVKGGKWGEETSHFDNGFTRWARFRDSRGEGCVYSYHTARDEWIFDGMGV